MLSLVLLKSFLELAGLLFGFFCGILNWPKEEGKSYERLSS